ncbi:MAG: response regulator [Bacteroidota bacterium]
MNGKIKIAVVDDHEMFRDGLKMVINQIDRFEVLFDAGDGTDFLEKLNKEIPDVVLMDINMPGLNGIETTVKAIEKNPDIKIIGLSMHDKEGYYMQMIKAGVKGYILKKSGKYELENAINEVFKGGNYFSPEIMRKFSFQLLTPDQNIYNRLTKREKEILLKVCEGHTSAQISEILFISPKTVEVHRTNIFSKVNVKNTAELIVWAIKNGVYMVD